MKRLLLILLTALLLAGCSRETPPTETTGSPETVPTQPTEPAGLYVPDSAVEKDTAGAVRVYALQDSGWFGLHSMGVNLLLTGENQMLVLTGEKGIPAAEGVVAGYTSASVMDISTTGAAYYIPESREIVILNPQLQPVSKLTLPEAAVGTPVISLIRNEVYYATAGEIRAMNVSTGISRLLRQTANMEILPQIYFDGNVLSCRQKNDAGEFSVEYISSETGQTLSTEQGILRMVTNKDRYFLWRMDGLVQQLVFGYREGEPQHFVASIPTVSRSGVVPVLAMNGAVIYEESGEALQLSYYDLGTGRKTAQVALAGVQNLDAIHCDGTYIWVLTGAEKQTLYRWEISKSPVADETVYTAPFYTAENPDTQGLADCQALADSYAKLYGVKLNIWQKAAKVTGGYAVVPEYQPQVIAAMLDKLQPALAQYPTNFLLKTVEAGWIQLSLVREIDGDRDWVHFWEDGDCYILLSAQGDVVQSFTQGVAYAIDSHVLGNSRDFDFDRWNPLNPKDFTYANSYDVQVKEEYLQGDTQAFTDKLGASYIHEDRSRVFYHAMLADNGEMFTAPTMQAKLLRLCNGIREAYGLQKSTETYPWEQYLDTPIAYVKK